MKNRQNRLSMKALSSLNANGQELSQYLMPRLQELEREGWDAKTLTDALVDHYSQTGALVLPKDLSNLLSPPTDLLLEYFRRHGKPNKPTGRQLLALESMLPNAKLRQKVSLFLSRHFVMSMLGSLEMKQIVDQLRRHEFFEPQVESVPGRSIQGRKFRWPENP